MNKNLLKIIILTLISPIFFTSCYITSHLVPLTPQVSVTVPVPGPIKPEVIITPNQNQNIPKPQIPNQNIPNNGQNNFYPGIDMGNSGTITASQIQFENAVNGKVWYSRLRNDGNYNEVYQIKLHFYPSNKTFSQEIYKWQKSTFSNTFYFSEVRVKTAKYYYNSNGQMDYELIEDYSIDNRNRKTNNSYWGNTSRSIWFNLDNSEMITFDGHQYISAQALRNQSVTDYTIYNQFELSNY